MQSGRRFLSSCFCHTCGSDERMSKQMEVEVQNPQAAYWRHAWNINGAAGLTLCGHSRALERTGFVIEELGLYLDAGVGWRNPTVNPEAILVTHGHIDHINALPMLLRCGDADPAVFVPLEHVNNVREMTRMTWSVKREDSTPGAGARDDFTDMPVFIKTLVEKSTNTDADSEHRYWPVLEKALPVEQGATRDFVPDKSHLAGVKGRMWVPTIPGVQYLLPGKKRIVIRTVHCFHTTTDVGYVVCQAVKTLQGKDADADAEYTRLREVAKTDKSAGKQIGEMRKQGLLVNVDQVLPLLAYLCDTTAQVLGPCDKCKSGLPGCAFVSAKAQFAESCFGYLAPDPASASMDVARVNPNKYAAGSHNPNHFAFQTQTELIFSCPTIVIECSFVGAGGMSEEEAETEAKHRGHASWRELAPHVKAHPESVFVLVHFSKRYTDKELREYFECKLGFQAPAAASASGDDAVTRNVVLFLDSGVVDFRKYQAAQTALAAAAGAEA